MPRPELVPLARIVCSEKSERMPLTIRGGSPFLLRVLEDSRIDGRRFVVYEQFRPEVFLQCVRQAHQDFFGMVEVSTLVENTVHRLKRALYEKWTEGRPVRQRCVREGYVDFCDLRKVLTDLIDLWSAIRSYIRITGNPDAKDTPDRVGVSFCSKLHLLCNIWLISV